jgi:hypothetical protein
MILAAFRRAAPVLALAAAVAVAVRVVGPRVPEALRPAIERRGRRYLRLHALSSAPGRFNEPAAPTPVAAEPVEAPPSVDEPVRPANLVPVRARSRAAALATPTPAPHELGRPASA